LDITGAMRAAFPLGIRHLVAARTGFPGWNRLMVRLASMSRLSNGRLDGSSQNEKNEHAGTEQKCAESVHGHNLLRRSCSIGAVIAAERCCRYSLPATPQSR
jgi:hypothetical protein